jgi:hypothetical protein
MEFDGRIFEVITEKDLECLVDKYTAYEEALYDWSNNHNIKLPSLKSVRGQVIALMTDNKFDTKLFTRDILDCFLNKMDLKSNDVIQIANKTDQWGLLHTTYKRKYYYIPRPYIYIAIHLGKRKNFGKAIDEASKLEKIKNTKDFLTKFYIDIPDNDWDMGHIDPTGKSDACNLVMQPPIQRAYRNRFKFDEHGLRLCPTIDELKTNVSKYYSQVEVENLRKYLSSL